MKNMLIRVCLLMMIAVMALSCTALGEAAPDADPALSMAAEVAAKVDFTQYPEHSANGTSLTSKCTCGMRASWKTTAGYSISRKAT